MSERYHIGTKAACEAVQATVDKLLGYPIEGVDVGGGRHVKHDKATGKGWTLHANAVEVERYTDDEPVPGGDHYTRVPDPDTEGDKRLLTGAEYGALKAAWAQGKPRPTTRPRPAKAAMIP